MKDAHPLSFYVTHSATPKPHGWREWTNPMTGEFVREFRCGICRRMEMRIGEAVRDENPFTWECVDRDRTPKGILQHAIYDAQ